MSKLGSWMNDVLTINPLALRELHAEYVANGADIITTCTFRTNCQPELVGIAVNEAKMAIAASS